MTKGDRVEVRAVGHTDWHNGVISFASANSKSLVVNLEDGALGVGRGMLYDPELGNVALMLYALENGYVDAASGEPVELRVMQEAASGAAG